MRVAAGRLRALDWMRGAVMVLMAVDHASGVFNAGRLVTDGLALHRPGAPLDPAQFLTRWITHLCAPTFVFLAGAALALSVEKRRAEGEPARVIDRFIVTRGLFIAALDPLWMSWVFVPGRVLLQVLYAIGGGLVAMAALRRLPDHWLLAAALVLLLGDEALTGLALSLGGGEPTLPVALLLTGGQRDGLIVAYPLVPWLAIMLLGWCFARFVHRSNPAAAGRLLVVAGAGALVLFALVRGVNDYGNMRLLREDGSLVQWLHVSKYPPSLSYAALELGLMALGLGWLLILRGPAEPRSSAPLVILGQTALFFYLLHVHVLVLAGTVLRATHHAGLATAYGAAAAVVVALYPLCSRYRRYKIAHPTGWTRYV